MAPQSLDRHRLQFHPLKDRENRVVIERDHVDASATPRSLSGRLAEALSQAIESIVAARSKDRPVVLAFGAHTIKNGLAPVIIRLMVAG